MVCVNRQFISENADYIFTITLFFSPKFVPSKEIKRYFPWDIEKMYQKTFTHPNIDPPPKWQKKKFVSKIPRITS